jgi:hypothetical protein
MIFISVNRLRFIPSHSQMTSGPLLEVEESEMDDAVRSPSKWDWRFSYPG